MKVCKEYEVTIYPTGEWEVYLIRDDISTRRAYQAYGKELTMTQAEAAARLWITKAREEKERKHERESEIKRFTVKA